jgi:Tfp pilus assembly protein PilE
MTTKALVLKILLAISLILMGILILLTVDYRDRIGRERAEAARRLAAEKALAIERHNQATATQEDVQALDKLKGVFGSPATFGGLKKEDSQ